MKRKMKMVMLLGMLFVLLGAAMHVAAVIMEFTQLAPLQEAYWSISEAERGAAPSGSPLTQMRVELEKFPPKLMTLKLVGIGSILIGIFTMLLGLFKAMSAMPMMVAGVVCPECAEKVKAKAGRKRR
ncbi:MAG TPA: hypothetical protein EYP90_02795 [Chromatiaceae bacterium]|nr:hypothetical protein [Chromatiaceae bacterium]